MDPVMMSTVRALCFFASERSGEPSVEEAPGPFEIDARQVELAKHAFRDLPAPVRTLLNTLQELKLAVSRERRRRHTAMDSTCMATLEAYVKVHVHCLDDTARSVKDLQESDAKHAQVTVKDLLSKDLAALAGKAVKLDPEFHMPDDFVQSIRAVEALCTRALRPQFEVSVVTFEDNGSKVLQRTAEALQRSKRICERLGTLGQGQATLGSPLPDAVQDMELNMQPEEHPVALPSVKRVSNVDEAFALDTRHAARALLSRAQALMATVSSKILVEDQIANALRSMKQFTRSVEAVEAVPAIEHVGQDPGLVQADKDVQREIKFVMQTIPTDKKALDQVLRCIRAALIHEEAQYAMERYGMWTKALNTWRLQVGEIKIETMS